MGWSKWLFGTAITFFSCVSYPSEKSCEALEEYFLGAKSNFVDLKMRKSSVGDWVPKIYLPQANRCSIIDDEAGGSEAKCFYMFLDENDRRVGIRQIRMAVASCLGWDEVDIISSERHSFNGADGVNISISPFGRFDAYISIEYVGNAK
ncbi:hypothetical protein [Cognatazoarcus halotolerans]|uniref:hypothetical protein n=1 Tax=Cognatazoarcus halotolerans TaxID=2686016 RepID=UPI0013589166|nr:hypothetical protein [Cognatazoarcus halotolerans]